MSIGQQVTLKKGTRVGMKTLKADTLATIIRNDGEIHLVEWYDSKGNRKTTWIGATK